jgi:enoyl-CoA hydratase/carnithine racemase
VTDLSKKQDAAGLLQIDKDAQGILRVTLNDPARRNALSEAMLDRLGAILADAAIDARRSGDCFGSQWSCFLCWP